MTNEEKQRKPQEGNKKGQKITNINEKERETKA